MDLNVVESATRKKKRIKKKYCGKTFENRTNTILRFGAEWIYLWENEYFSFSFSCLAYNSRAPKQPKNVLQQHHMQTKHTNTIETRGGIIEIFELFYSKKRRRQPTAIHFGFSSLCLINVDWQNSLKFAFESRTTYFLTTSFILQPNKKIYNNNIFFLLDYKNLFAPEFCVSRTRLNEKN